MIAIRFHGRGGQGAVVASKILAAAMFEEGWQVQAFPAFGAERSGAPVAAFLRADHAPITAHYQVYEPDAVVVLDPVLMSAVDVTAGLRPGGWIVVNTRKHAAELPLAGDFRVVTCDATAVALRHGLGSRTMPIVNTAMAGAFAASTGLVSLQAILTVIPQLVPAKAEANRAAACEAFRAAEPAETQAPAGEARHEAAP